MQALKLSTFLSQKLQIHKTYSSCLYCNSNCTENSGISHCAVLVMIVHRSFCCAAVLCAALCHAESMYCYYGVQTVYRVLYLLLAKSTILYIKSKILSSER